MNNNDSDALSGQKLFNAELIEGQSLADSNASLARSLAWDAQEEADDLSRENFELKMRGNVSVREIRTLTTEKTALKAENEELKAAIEKMEGSYRESLLLLEKRDRLLRAMLAPVADLRKASQVYRNQLMEVQKSLDVSEDEAMERCRAAFEALEGSEFEEYAKKLFVKAGADDETIHSMSTVMSREEKQAVIEKFQASGGSVIFDALVSKNLKDFLKIKYEEKGYIGLPHAKGWFEKITPWTEKMVPLLAPGGERSKVNGWVIPLPKAEEENENRLNARELFRIILGLDPAIPKFIELFEKQSLSPDEFKFLSDFISAQYTIGSIRPMTMMKFMVT